jgi:hypothetical protein
MGDAMLRFANKVKNAVIFFHRWMGVVFCSLFLLWFASGMFMMYCDYPLVSEADRLNHSPELNPAAIRLSPQDAYAILQMDMPPAKARIEMFDGRPVYRFDNGFEESLVYADDGQRLNDFTPEMTLRIASAWAGKSPAAAKMEEKTAEDQWTVSEEFDELRPLRKYSWPDGQEVYVSTVTGAVVQYTTRASRMGAYFGPIPHWLYFTALRKRQSVWSRCVIWASGLGTVAALLGIAIGAWTYSPSKTYLPAGKNSSMPYLGSKRWHMSLGLIFGPLACTWAFSGMLSMDPFPRLQHGEPDLGGAQLTQALRASPVPLAAFDAFPPREALLRIGANFRAKEVELTSVMGEPCYIATSAPNQTLVIPVVGQPKAEFDRESIVDLIRRVVLPHKLAEVRLVTQYEAYYLDRHGTLPLPVIFVSLDDEEHSMYFIDPKTAQVIESYNSHSRWNRWLYHGLHSIDIPWLYRNRPAWDIVVLALLIGGTALCVTSLMLAWRVVRRTL